MPDAPIRIVDSLTVTGGLGSQVAAAARAAQREGRRSTTSPRWLRRWCLASRLYGCLDTLENLKKGGRVGGAQAFIGSLLSIKPLIEVRDGVVHEAGKPRTRGKAIRQLAEKPSRRRGPVENVYVMHGLAPDVGELVDLVAAIVPRDEITVGIIGATIGTHGGPRVLGITFQTAE